MVQIGRRRGSRVADDLTVREVGARGGIPIVARRRRHRERNV